MKRTLEKIYQSAVRLSLPLDMDELYAMCIKEAKQLVKAEYGSIFLASDGELHRVYSSVPDTLQLEPRKDGFSYESYSKRKINVLSITKIRAGHPELKDHKIKSFIIIPLSYREDSIGVLTVLSTKYKYFTNRKTQLLKIFGALVSLKIKNTQLFIENQNALKARDLFISMASHELKTPLTTINGYAQLLYQKLHKGERPKEKWVETLLAETNRLSHLINELLHIEKIKTNKLQFHFEKNSVKKIIQRAINTFNFSYPTYQIKMTDELEGKKEVINCDSEKLLQVFTNLLNNAAKFSPDKSIIEIKLTQQDKRLMIQIIDTGKGIAEKDIPRIFDGFYKGSDHTKEGMGLGLYICRNIIDRHHGTIKVDSKLKQGTTITIQLPHTL